MVNKESILPIAHSSYDMFTATSSGGCASAFETPEDQA
jgi:hypothetical protein